METLTSENLTIFLFTVGFMLILARILAKAGAQFHIPSVIAEFLAGILLGPTVLGHLFPEISSIFFPESGGLAAAYETLFDLSIIMLLFVAGLEIDFSLLSKAAKKVILTSLFAILFTFTLAVFCGWHFFDFFHGTLFSIAPFEFPLIFGLLTSLTSLAIIARLLIANQMINTPLGLTIIGTGVVIDLLGWFGFSAILVYTSPIIENVYIIYTILYIVAFFIIAFFISGLDKIKKLMIHKKSEEETSFDIALLFGVCLISSAFTNGIHIHPTLGAFIAGIMCRRLIGDQSHILHQLELFIMNFFAPIFFISIGLRVNFIENFNFPMIAALFCLMWSARFIGAFLGARLAGFASKPATTIGLGLNTRGTMEILMGAIALKLALISPQLFVSFVIVAITSGIIVELTFPKLIRQS